MDMKSALDLSKAAIVACEGIQGAEAKAIDVLIEEVGKRTGITLPLTHQHGLKHSPSIVVGTAKNLQHMIDGSSELQLEIEQLQPEGYLLQTVVRDDRAHIFIIGADARGVLYGVGRFLRKAVMQKQSIKMDSSMKLITSPRYRTRGHQLGYRPKTNAYDAWTVETYEQYIRELALFGANSIEIVPPRTDDDATGPLMKVDPMEMMIRLSEIIDSYGLDVWIWYPNMGDDYTDPQTRAFELAEREEIFSKLKRINVVMIPGSDPGGMHPDRLFEWSEEVSDLLKRYHPAGQIWLAPQVMKYEPKPWLDSFYENMDREPEWLGGVVFGPHVDEMLPQFRERIPVKYPICRYEDITHNYVCQYPVANWDMALARTVGREGFNPRPVAEKHIHNVFAPYAIGNISYSEGINDDVNKFVWSDQDWDPDTSVMETLRDFARLFIGSEYAEPIARGLMALEENWEGPLIVNEQVEVTLLQWMQMEREAAPEVLDNYRFQMGLIRAYFDAYVKRRLIYETELEARAKDALRFAPVTGSLEALKKVEQQLRLAKEEPVAQDYKQRCHELADKLFNNIGYQLTVGRHFAIGVDRGAFIDSMDYSLNDIDWLLTQCAIIRGLDTEDKRLEAIHHALNRTNPGPGGYYSNFGAYGQDRRVDPGLGWEQDPGYLISPRTAAAFYLFRMKEEEKMKLGGVPLAWVQHVNTMTETPIHITYSQLDPHSAYKVKVTYVGDTIDPNLCRDTWVRMTVNDKYRLQDEIQVKEGKCTIQESLIPQEVLVNGELKLTFQRIRGFKRLNIAEIWVTRQT